MSKIITLLTDFGLKDPYVGIMKGVILSICPEAKIIDISHEIEPQNIKHGAFVLESFHKYFPSGSIHVVVIDPGVGSKRRGLCICTKEYIFIGPDNGVFSPILKKNTPQKIYELQNKNFFASQISHTFHGRDIFAPVAAYLAQGLDPYKLGPEVKDPLCLSWSSPLIEGNKIRGEILYVDRFGNLISNIPWEMLKGRKIKRISFQGLNIPFKKTYSEVHPKKPVALIGSEGFLEIAIYLDSAYKTWGNKGEVIVELHSLK